MDDIKTNTRAIEKTPKAITIYDQGIKNRFDRLKVTLRDKLGRTKISNDQFLNEVLNVYEGK